MDQNTPNELKLDQMGQNDCKSMILGRFDPKLGPNMLKCGKSWILVQFSPKMIQMSQNDTKYIKIESNAPK